MLKSVKSGIRRRTEYEIKSEAASVSANGRTAHAKIVFSRRVEYHLITTFLQTFSLVGIGYMTLFFAEDNFSDRVMATLTTLLVVAMYGMLHLSSRCRSSVIRWYVIKLRRNFCMVKELFGKMVRLRYYYQYIKK